MYGCLVYATEGLLIYLLNNSSAETFALCLAHFFLSEKKEVWLYWALSSVTNLSFTLVDSCYL